MRAAVAGEKVLLIKIATLVTTKPAITNSPTMIIFIVLVEFIISFKVRPWVSKKVEPW